MGSSHSQLNEPEQILALDMSKVVKQGKLLKKSGVFKGFQTKQFFLEENFLKYGKVGREVTSLVDLREAFVVKHRKYTT